jgi:hypothetical protein
MTKRRTWIIGLTTALFALQIPLCALACIPGTSADIRSADAAPPCHESAPTSAPPMEEPASQSECCGSTEDALLQTPDSVQTSAGCAIPAPLATAQAHRRAFPVPPDPRVTDLPPPDILLLNSTWIV